MIWWMVALTNHFIVLARFIAQYLWHYGGFCNIFWENTGEDQKKILTSEYGTPGTVPYNKSDPGSVA